MEGQTVDASGEVTWIRGTLIGHIRNGKLTHAWNKRADITAQKRYEAAIHRKAQTDPLTGLPNRYWFQDKVDKLMRDHAARNKEFCLGLLDLNGFKEINDTLGHLVGDQILQAMSVRLLKGLKLHGAEMARLGGDEFAILMPEISHAGKAEDMARELQSLLAEPFTIEHMPLKIGGSLGLTLFSGVSSQNEDLLRMADIAMYAAKSDGLPYRWYHPDIDRHSKRRLSLLNSLGEAISGGELFLVYQPKIDVWNNELSGFEALLRWAHPSMGLIPPNEFIPHAETNEVILPLTRWVIAQAITQGAAWLAAGHRIKMAVNISVRNLLDDQLEQHIANCLQTSGLPADLLELEVTESALMTHPAQAMALLHSLRALGISIAIDDFGTGYSSLAYLARLPVTTLKVDQAFVKDMLRSTTDEQIVRSIIGLAHQCQLTVVAEGVEDGQTLSALLNMGCDHAQGYHIGRPMTVADAEQWIATHINTRQAPGGIATR
ncbi:MAG TPA: EAL domain-containing protein, partial [Rhodocyclaceae bacterium]|nr:EAL domain-containing protein [Rhodocyclaceae bacterium]